MMPAIAATPIRAKAYIGPASPTTGRTRKGASTGPTTGRPPSGPARAVRQQPAVAVHHHDQPLVVAVAGDLAGQVVAGLQRLDHLPACPALGHDDLAQDVAALVELAQDRLVFPPGTGSEAGRPGSIEALADGAGLLRALVERAVSE